MNSCLWIALQTSKVIAAAAYWTAKGHSAFLFPTWTRQHLTQSSNVRILRLINEVLRYGTARSGTSPSFAAQASSSGALSECNSLADLLPRKWLQARIQLSVLFELAGYAPTAWVKSSKRIRQTASPFTPFCSLLRRSLETMMWSAWIRSPNFSLGRPSDMTCLPFTFLAGKASCYPYWQPWETWGAPLHTFSWKLKHNSMSATAVTAAAGNFLQTRFSGFGGHSRPRPHKHSPEHGLGLCEHHQNNFQKCFFLLRVSWKNTGLMSWEFMGKRDIVQDHMQDIARFLTFLRKAVKPRQRAKTL